MSEFDLKYYHWLTQTKSERMFGYLKLDTFDYQVHRNHFEDSSDHKYRKVRSFNILKVTDH